MQCFTGSRHAFASSLARALLPVAAAVLTACPGQISDPERFLGDGQGEVEVPCGLPDTCGGGVCHSASEPASELDLVTADPAPRLVDVPSVVCEGRLLIDSENPEASFLLEKVSTSDPECGAPMPFTGDGLSMEDVRCVEDFIHELVEGGAAADAGVGP